MVANADSAICMDVIGCLKRCLAQPASTRQLLYAGLTVACTREESLIGHSLDLMLTHSSTMQKLDVENYVAKCDGSIREPIAHLIQASGMGN